MRIAKFLAEPNGPPQVGLVEQDEIISIGSGHGFLSGLLADPNLGSRLNSVRATRQKVYPLGQVQLLPPIDDHEVWGAGVTYERSKVARQEESEQGGSFYDLVYRAERPELFFKATPSRVVGTGDTIRVRADTRWCVPEPELALILTPKLELVGFTIGNDVSARDIEGENPLYLPQAKLYDRSCALGPWITLASAMPDRADVNIQLRIERNAVLEFEGRTSLARMARTFEDLIHWLGRDNLFPQGVVLLTGTGIVPPDEFTLRSGDRVRIEIDGIGQLENVAVQGS